MRSPSKPLPAFPSQSAPESGVPLLTPQAHDHLRKVIARGVEDEDLLTSWTPVLVQAVMEMGKTVTNAKSLAGIRRLKFSDHSIVRELEEPGVSANSNVKSGERVEDDAKENDDLPSRPRSPFRSRGKEEDNQALLALYERSHSIASLSPRMHHLLITLSPLTVFSHYTLGKPTCTFHADRFELPRFESKYGIRGSGAIDITGIETWKVLHRHSLNSKSSINLEDIRIIGGSFWLSHVSSDVYDSLVKVLRLSVYTYLSIVIELSFLKNSGVKLEYPVSPPLPSIPLPPLESGSNVPASSDGTHGQKGHSGIWSYISRKTADIRNLRPRSIFTSRHATESPPQRTAELPPSLMAPPPTAVGMVPVASMPSRVPPSRTPGAVTTALRGIRHESSIFSTSYSVKLEPPPFLVRLAKDEDDDEKLGETPNKARMRKRLTGTDKVTLSAILGWKSDGSGGGFGNVNGFIKHQAITVLYSSPHLHHDHNASGRTRPVIPPPGGVSPLTPSHPRWKTYRYYDEHQETLEAWIRDVFSVAENNPDNLDALKHTWCHNSLKLTAELHRAPEDVQLTDEDVVTTHLSCCVCHIHTSSVQLEDASLILDFGKFLELAFYSKELTKLSIPICSHISESDPITEPHATKFNLMRHYTYRWITLSFKLSSIKDMYNAQIPRTQVTKGIAEVMRKEHPFLFDDYWLQEEREKLRLDMTLAWKTIKDYLVLLEENAPDSSTVSTVSTRKQLPTPPCESPDNMTPTGSQLGPSGSSSGHSSPLLPRSSRASFTIPGTTSTSISTSTISTLRSLIHSAEHSLYLQLSESGTDNLNNIRRAFISSASDAQQRLYNLLPLEDSQILDDLKTQLPEWWQKGIHCPPDSGVVLSENDWGSLIAFTLRSPEYRYEVQDMSLNPTLSTASTATVKPMPVHMNRNSSFTWKSLGHHPSPASRPGFLAGASLKQERNGSSMSESEEFSACITRMENPREVSSLLNLPGVLLRRRSHDESAASSRFATLGMTASRILGGVTSPAAAWSKPDVQVSLDVGQGVVSAFPQSSGATDTENVVTPTKQPEAGETSDYQTLESVSTHMTSVTSEETDTVTDPSSPSRHVKRSEPSNAKSGRLVSDGSPAKGASKDTPMPISAHFGSPISAVLRGFITPRSNEEVRPMAPAEDASYRLALLGPDQNPSYPKINERPHLKYEFIVGRRLQFSCIVYYALQFATLRRQCGVDEVLIRSLEKTTAWIAEGGKSRSSFFKTSDNRFILKTMVSSWNVADLPAILELAPAYFAYVGRSQEKTSALAKLLGFYTVEIKNLETGVTESKADLLVMENLFYSQNVEESFDLKGIKGRKSKGDSTANTRTLFDQEWMEKQRHSPMYLHPRSKHLLQESLNADVDFLCESNIMDYSLLIGVDESHKVLTCGLVDTFGTYTLAKTLESKAKQGLNTDKEKEITVVPPSDYRARFLKAVDKYFLTIPDKWSKPLNGFSSQGEFFRGTQVL